MQVITKTAKKRPSVDFMLEFTQTTDVPHEQRKQWMDRVKAASSEFDYVIAVEIKQSHIDKAAECFGDSSGPTPFSIFMDDLGFWDYDKFDYIGRNDFDVALDSSQVYIQKDGIEYAADMPNGLAVWHDSIEWLTGEMQRAMSGQQPNDRLFVLKFSEVSEWV